MTTTGRGEHDTETRADVDAIEARANAASSGPWKVRPWTWAPHRRAEVTMVMTPNGCLFNDFNGMNDAADAEFVAHARTDVPALVAEVRRLRSLVGGERVEAVARKLWEQSCTEYDYEWESNAEQFRSQAREILSVAFPVVSS